MNAQQRRAMKAARVNSTGAVTAQQFGSAMKAAGEMAAGLFEQDPQHPGRQIVEHGITVLTNMATAGLHLGTAGGLRRDFDETEARCIYHEGVEQASRNFHASVDTEVAQQTAALRTRLEQEAAEQLARDRAHLTQQRDDALTQLEAAVSDNTALERQLQATQAQLARAHQEHDEALYRVRQSAQREREQFVARERALNEQRAQLERDLKAAQAIIASLNSELETLTAPQETPMIQPVPNPFPLTALERMSFHVYQQQRGLRALEGLEDWRRLVTDHLDHCRQHLIRRGHLQGRAA